MGTAWPAPVFMRFAVARTASPRCTLGARTLTSRVIARATASGERPFSIPCDANEAYRDPAMAPEMRVMWQSRQLMPASGKWLRDHSPTVSRNGCSSAPGRAAW